MDRAKGSRSNPKSPRTASLIITGLLVVWAGCGGRQAGVADAVRGAVGGGALVFQQLQVVDPGHGRDHLRGLFHLGVAVPPDGVRLRVPVAGAAAEHLDLGEVERGVADRHRPAGPLRGGLMHVALERDRGGAGGHGPDGLPQERGIQLRGAGEPGRARVPPGQRRRAGGGVDPHVVLVLGPGGEPAVELPQAVRYPAAGGGLAVGGDLDQELPPHSLEKAFYLAAALGLTGQSRLILWITGCRGGPGSYCPGSRRARSRRRSVSSWWRTLAATASRLRRSWSIWTDRPVRVLASWPRVRCSSM